MLKGKKINLRLIRESDIEDYVRLTHDVAARGPFFPLDLTPEPVARKRFHEDGFWSEDFKTFVIVDPVVDRMIGLISAFKPVFYHESFELGYILHDITRRGEGIMAEAVDLFCSYLFEWKNVNRIQLQIEADNIASKRTAEKAGFKHEGTMRSCLLAAGRYRDMELYSKLRSEHDSKLFE